MGLAARSPRRKIMKHDEEIRQHLNLMTDEDLAAILHEHNLDE
jgi:hypothetical protein